MAGKNMADCQKICMPYTYHVRTQKFIISILISLISLPGKKNVDQYDKNSNNVGDKCDTCDNGSSDPDCFVDVLPACTGTYLPCLLVQEQHFKTDCI